MEIGNKDYQKQIDKLSALFNNAKHSFTVEQHELGMKVIGALQAKIDKKVADSLEIVVHQAIKEALLILPELR